jgi:methionyl-tRNA formyltransferase
MRIVFFGTPAFAVPSFLACLQGHEVVAAVTKSRAERPSPVAAVAQRHGVPVLAVDRLHGEALKEVLRLSFEVGVVAAYGSILPPTLVQRGLLNVHPSLLPRWRGPNPIRCALWHGDRETGVSVLWLTEEVDAGPVVWQQRTPIGSDEDYGELSLRLADLGAAGLAWALSELAAGRKLVGVPQGEAGVTYARRLSAADETIPEELPGEETWWRLRALSPEPGGKLALAGRVVLVRKARWVPGAPLAAGQLALRGEELWQGRPGGAVALVTVQPPGRRPMSGASFARGYLRGVPLA